jgi:hypothetical protein
MMMKREKDNILKEALVHLYSDTRKVSALKRA